MIENKLTGNELNLILSAVLRLENAETILADFKYVFPEKLKTLDDIMEYTRRYLVTYKGFKIFIKGIGELSTGSVYIEIDFRIDKKWWNIVHDPTKKLIKELKEICKKEIDSLTFSKYETNGYSYPYYSKNQQRFTFYYQSYAFNSSWKEGSEVSPLIIAPSENDKYFFVEFSFNANCYSRINNKTILKENWKNYISDTTTFVEKKADELLKYGFKK
jgi:hypothetical protein